MRASTSSAEPNRTDPSRAFEPHACRGDERFGRWRLIEFLAAGGTAELWRAVDSSGAEAALKIVAPTAMERLRSEQVRLATLRHASIVRPFDLVVEPGRPAALALELLPGGDLVPLLGMPPRHWLAALSAVVDAVRYLHERGVAHRDLKARNVLFAADGTVRLVDFGSACAADAPGGGSAGATAAHLPADAAVTAREADVFALAVLVYELVTGRLPFGAAGAQVPGARPAPCSASDPVGARLAAAASDAMAADGRGPEGLSALVDVIESAALRGELER